MKALDIMFQLASSCCHAVLTEQYVARHWGLVGLPVPSQHCLVLVMLVHRSRNVQAKLSKRLSLIIQAPTANVANKK